METGFRSFDLGVSKLEPLTLAQFQGETWNPSEAPVLPGTLSRSMPSEFGEAPIIFGLPDEDSLKMGEAPVLLGPGAQSSDEPSPIYLYDSEGNLTLAEGDDDFDSVSPGPIDNGYQKREDNEREMNAPLPLEAPLLSDAQKKVFDELYPALEQFFAAGGFSGNNGVLLRKIVDVLNKPENNGVIDREVMDLINMQLRDRGLFGRISSFAGETYLGTLTRQSPDRYTDLLLITKEADPQV